MAEHVSPDGEPLPLSGHLALPFRSLSAPLLSARHPLFFSDDDTVCYVTGRHVVLNNVSTDSQTFIAIPATVRAVVAAAISPSLRFIALAERTSSDASCQVSVYSTAQSRSIAVVALPDARGSSDVLALSFSGDGRHLCVQCGAPDYRLIHFRWDASRMEHTLQLQSQVSASSVSPFDTGLFLTTGPRLLKFWRHTEGIVRGVSPPNLRRTPDHYRCTAWTDPDSVVVSCVESGDLLHLHRGSLSAVTPAAVIWGKVATVGLPFFYFDADGSPVQNGGDGDPPYVTSIVASRSVPSADATIIVLGTSDGLVVVLAAAPSKSSPHCESTSAPGANLRQSSYRAVFRARLPTIAVGPSGAPEVKDIALSPNASTLAVLTSLGQVYLMSVALCGRFALDAARASLDEAATRDDQAAVMRASGQTVADALVALGLADTVDPGVPQVYALPVPIALGGADTGIHYETEFIHEGDALQTAADRLSRAGFPAELMASFDVAEDPGWTAALAGTRTYEAPFVSLWRPRDVVPRTDGAHAAQQADMPVPGGVYPLSNAGILDIAISNSPPLATVIADDSLLRIFDYTSGRLVSQVPVPGAKALAFHPFGTLLAVAAADAVFVLAVSPFTHPEFAAQIPLHNVATLAFSPAGDYLAAAHPPSISMIRVSSLAVERTLSAPSVGSARVGLSFSPSGRLLAAVGMGGGAYTYKVHADLTDIEGGRISDSVVKLCAYTDVLLDDPVMLLPDGAAAGVSPSDLSDDRTAAADSVESSIPELSNTPAGFGVTVGAGGALPMPSAANIDGMPLLTACIADGRIRLLAGGTATHEFPTGPARVSRMCRALVRSELSEGTTPVIVGGTTGGTVRVYRSPMHEADISQVALHAAPITAIAVAQGSFVVSGDAVGGILISRLHESSADGPVCAPAHVLPHFNVTVSVPPNHFRAVVAAAASLVQRLSELRGQSMFDARVAAGKHAEVVAQMRYLAEASTTEAEQTVRSLRAQLAGLAADKEAALKDERAAHAKVLADLEGVYSAKLAAQTARADTLHERLEDEACAAHERESALNEEHFGEIEAASAARRRERESLLAQQDEIKADLLALQAEYETKLAQQEDEGDTLFAEARMRMQAQIEELRQANTALSGEASVLKRRAESLHQTVEQHRNDLQDANSQIEAARRRQAEKDELLASLRHDVAEREQLVAEQEKRILGLRRRVAELDKFKYVLDYKLRELQREVEPRDALISDLREQMSTLDSELEASHRNWAVADLAASRARQRVQAHETELRRLRVELAQGQRRLDAISGTIIAAQKDATSFPAPRDAGIAALRHLRQLATQVGLEQPDAAGGATPGRVGPTGSTPSRATTRAESRTNSRASSRLLVSAMDSDANDGAVLEGRRQRAYLERSVRTLRSAVDATSTRSAVEASRRISENAELLKEVNELRIANRHLQAKVGEMRRRLSSLKMENTGLKRLADTRPARYDSETGALPPGAPPGTAGSNAGDSMGSVDSDVEASSSVQDGALSEGEDLAEGPPFRLAGAPSPIRGPPETHVPPQSQLQTRKPPPPGPDSAPLMRTVSLSRQGQRPSRTALRARREDLSSVLRLLDDAPIALPPGLSAAGHNPVAPIRPGQGTLPALIGSPAPPIRPGSSAR
jgi:WD40 repeat protein